MVAEENVPFVPASNTSLGFQQIVSFAVPLELLSRADISSVANQLDGDIGESGWMSLPILHDVSRVRASVHSPGLLVVLAFVIVVESQLESRSGEVTIEINLVKTGSTFVNGTKSP